MNCGVSAWRKPQLRKIHKTITLSFAEIVEALAPMLAHCAVICLSTLACPLVVVQFTGLVAIACLLLAQLNR